MTATVVNSVSAAANVANSVTTAGLNITAGNNIYAFLTAFTGNATPDDASVTDSVGNTYSRVGGTTPLVGSEYIACYKAENVIGGAAVTVTGHTNNVNDYPRILVVQVSGALTAASIDQSNFVQASTSATTITSGALTTTVASELLLACGADNGTTTTEAFADGGAANNTGAWTNDTAQTSTGAGMSAGLAHATVASTGTYAATMTTSASTTARMLALITIKSAAVGLAAGTLSLGATGATTQALSIATNSGGTAPYSNQLQQSTNGGTTWTNVGAPVAGATASWTVTGLTPGQAYQFRVNPVTDSASGSATSNTVSVTIPQTTVSAPASGKVVANQTNVVVEVTGVGTSWASGTTWSVTGMTGAAVTNKTWIDATHYRLYLTVSTVDASGALTLSNSADASTATLTVVSSIGGAARRRPQ